MDWLASTYAPGGRIGRLQYFLGAIVGSLLCLVPAALIGLLALLVNAFPGGAVLRTILLTMAVLVIVAGITYVSVILIVKRLNDLDFSGWNAVWVVGVAALAQAGDAMDAGFLALVFGVANLGIGLWLLFAPGDALVQQVRGGAVLMPDGAVAMEGSPEADDASYLLGLMLDPSGRIPRLPYVVASVSLCVLYWIVAFMVEGLAGVAASIAQAASGDGSAILVVGKVLAAALLAIDLYASTVLDVKRLRDMGFPGWPAALPLSLSIASWIALTPSMIHSSPITAVAAVLIMQPLSFCITLILAIFPGDAVLRRSPVG